MNQIRGVVNKLFTKYLLATNTITCGALLAVGDVVTQNIEKFGDESKKNRKHDKARTGRMFCVGFVFGPFNHVWYKVLDRFVLGTGYKMVFKKICCDQAVAAPFFCSAFFFSMSLLEGKSIKACVQEVREKFLTVYMIDWCVWPPAQFINFYFLPPKARVVYVSFITLCWNTFLSYMKHAGYSAHD